MGASKFCCDMCVGEDVGDRMFNCDNSISYDIFGGSVIECVPRYVLDRLSVFWD